ncbi:MAG: ActS/PrrB/RegB family redox-sensitive histidine kinase, partial [Pseudomonadota bacterium]
LGFQLPVAYCLAAIALSAWVNVILTILYPSRKRLGTGFATGLLAYDIVQLMALLYLTGGIENPFTMLIMVPVIVSAATLPIRNTIFLSMLVAVAIGILIYNYYPLPWFDGFRFQLPFIYKTALASAIGASMVFLSLYAWRLAEESRQMSTALAATELVLSREQKLHALDGLAAAAAHELGTPLSTIVLVTKELENERSTDAGLVEDMQLLRSQAERCREILQKLTRSPDAQDLMHATLSVRELIDEASAPYRDRHVLLSVKANAARGAAEGEDPIPEPIGERQPGLIFGLGNLIENAVSFANTRVDVIANWDEDTVNLTISDDGPGFPNELMDSLGDPYVTTRSAAQARRRTDAGGLGLGFFIAKTLLERSGATVELDNEVLPKTGAIVKISWPRSAFHTDKARI